MPIRAQEGLGGHIELSDLQMQQLISSTIDIVGEVDEDMSLCVLHAVAWFNSSARPDITVNINSAGGSAHHGLTIYDTLRLYPRKKTGIAVGQASSAAAIILQACTHRCAAKHASLLIHLVSNMHVGMDQIYGKKLAKLRRQMEETQMYVERIISARTGKTLRQVRARCDKDELMSAEEALKFGLIDEII